MGYSQDKNSAGTTLSRRSQKRKRNDADSEIPVEDARTTNSSKVGGNTPKKLRGHGSLAAVTAIKEARAPVMGKQLSASMKDTSNPQKPFMDKDYREKGKPERDGEKPKRFIVFIGNLPFTATTASISKHFASLKPSSIRHITHKDQPTKSKGFAFLEFDGYDRMKTCLKLHHQSTFDDGLSAARKINVELTAGGGGAKSKERRTRLKTKNQKLNEERKRRNQEEDKAKQDKRNFVEDASDIHPSRRNMVPTA
ncbi:hypothetical protein FGG08_001954 [Glutinoglossum americanum]|uniref:RRM domain-containing protein n=1 Tax=Glutinoglossum americanum TaxID=1670608 RepID=A0A9P8IAL8_9PEZI|nr:hypothetical protein FGG08_001954 [Glutinoglossum americanum]